MMEDLLFFNENGYGRISPSIRLSGVYGRVVPFGFSDKSFFKNRLS